MDSVTRDRVIQEIKDRFEEMLPYFNAGMKHGPFWAEDAGLLRHGAEPVYGKPAIEAIMGTLEAKASPRMVETSFYEVQALSPEYAFLVLKAKIYYPKMDKYSEIKALTIWKKIGGQWFIFRDMFNTNSLDEDKK